MGFLFPSRTPSLRMNQLNNIQTPKSKATRADPLRRHWLPPHRPARQSKRCELRAAFPPIRAPMPAAGSSILRFTGLLLDACSYSNTHTQLSLCHLAAEPVCIASCQRSAASAAEKASKHPRAEVGQLVGERDVPSRRAAAATETQHGLGHPAAAQIIR